LIRRIRRSLSSLLLGLSVAPCAACSGAPPEPALAKTPPRPADTAMTFESPARWLAFPESAGTPLASLDLGGQCLVTTDDGQRWLVTPKKGGAPCDGVGLASGSPTLEALVSIQKVGDELRFIGEGGVVYTSKEPIGPFVRSSRAPTFLRSIASRGATTVAIDETGSVFTFDGAWRAAPMPPGISAVDVGADDAGRVLMIAAPEALYLSGDGGRTFALPPGPPTPRIGAFQVGLTKSGQLAARGLVGSLVLEKDSLTKSIDPIADHPAVQALIQPAAGPRASLVADQLAALDGHRYYELGELGDADARWKLVRTDLGELGEAIPLVGRNDCENLKIAARGSEIVLACLKSDPDQPDLVAELFASHDAGETFEPLTKLSAQTFADVAFAIGPDGSTLAMGVCVPGEPRAESDEKEKIAAAKPPAKPSKRPERDKPRDSIGCAPRAPIWVHRDRGRVDVVSGTAPHLDEGTGRAPSVSLDGRTLFFLGSSRKEGKTALFVSKDGGKSYVARALESPQGSDAYSEEEGYSEAAPDRYRMLEVHEGAHLSFDESGALGLVVDTQSGNAYATLDTDGRVVNLSLPPEYGAQVGGAGNRAVSVGYGQNDGVLRAWESLDGGATWTEIATTQAVTRFLDKGDSAIVCSVGGCVFGNELLRLGWEGQAETALDVPEDIPNQLEPTLSAPIACQLTPKTEWTHIDGRGDDSSEPRLPRLRELARGKTLWSVAARDDEAGSIDVVSAGMPEQNSPLPMPAKKPLLPASQGKGRVATTLVPQNEGFAAMRVTVPTTKVGGVDLGKAVDRVEIAWTNHFTGTTAKRTVKLEGGWTNALAVGNQLRPSLLTIAGPGLVAQTELKKKATFFDAQSRATVFDYPDWDALFTDGRPPTHRDATFLGGNPFAVALVDRPPNGSAVALSRAAVSEKDAAARPQWTSQAATLARSGAELEWLYASERVGFVAMSPDPSGAHPMSASGWLLEPDGTLGPTIELPTLADLPDKPKPCTVEQRKATPRSVSPHFGRSGIWLQPAGRRALLIHDINAGGAAHATSAATFTSAESVWMLTDGAVLHGTKKDPCVAAFRASSTRSGVVALVGADLEHSWVLRRSVLQRPGKGGAPANRWVAGLEAHPLTCRIQADLAVPYEVVSRAGQRMMDDQP
jgi:hypothetical protein